MASAPSALRNENALDLELLAVARRAIAPPVQFLGFWAAISLPFVYLPLLADGFRGAEPTVFALLLAVHVAALVVGHGHRR